MKTPGARAGARAIGVVAFASLATAAAIAVGCRPPTLQSPWGGPPSDGSDPSLANASSSASSSASAAEVAADLPPTWPILDVPKMTSWLDDPRLAAVKTKREAKDAGGAARALETFLGSPESSSLDAKSRAELDYFAASLFIEAGSGRAALDHADASKKAGGPLAAMADLRAVDALVMLGRPADAIARAAKIDRAVISDKRLDDRLIEPLIATGDIAAAETRIRRMLLSGSRPFGWMRRALAISKALLRTPDEKKARLAAELALAVKLDMSKGRGAKEADEVLSRATPFIPKDARGRYDETASQADRLERAERLVVAQEGKRALAEIDRLEGKRGGKKPPTATPFEGDDASRCRLEIARGKALALVKRSGEGIQALDRAAPLCAAGEKGPDALFVAAKALAKEGSHAEAKARCDKLEAFFPKSTLADDARLIGAKEAREGGDTATFKKKLEALADDYPESDQKADALFALAIEAMDRGAWAEARPYLEKGALLPVERGYVRSGRFTYYLARALRVTGHADLADAAFERTLVEAPLSYYGALAASALDAQTKGRARKVLEEAMKRPPKKLPPRFPADSPEKDPAIGAAVALARLGDTRGLEDVFDSVGIRAREATPSWLLLGAELYGLAGDRRAAHLLLRSANETESVKRRELVEMRVAPPSREWRWAWELAYPQPFEKEVAVATAESPLPSSLLYAIMREESAFAPAVESPANAKGLTQVIPATGRRVARNLGMKFNAGTLIDPGDNLRIGARYLKNQRDHFGAAPVLAIPAYNAGPGAPDRWLEDRPHLDFDLWVEHIPYTETREYTKRVVTSWFAYEVLYGSGIPELPTRPL